MKFINDFSSLVRATKGGPPLEQLLDEKLQEVDEDEIEDIAAFLRTLSDSGYFKDEPTEVPSGLTVGGFE